MNTFQDWMTLRQAAKELPTRPHVSTVYRWCLKGCRGMRLEHQRIGGRIIVSREGLRRFIESLTAADQATETERETPQSPRPGRRREAAVDHAEGELAAAGW